ncbi:translation elongation factor Ts [Candidatus Dependentiae bacterium]|nr:translation elongation factor Ts [Candidatus Dependentiae bacterium]
MSTVSMDLVKELREKTQVGMMDCKKALTEANGDLEKAIEILRKKGAAVAAKRAGNATDNGRIEAFVAVDSKKGSLVSICCETDFSANTTDMQDFAKKVAQESCALAIEDKNELLSKCPALQNQLNDLLAKISEKIEINNIHTYVVEKHGAVAVYIHPGSTVGVMIELASEKELTASSLEEVKQLGKDICMQIAVHKPVALTSADLDPAVVAKERAIAEEQSNDGKKPANIIAKIIENRMNKFLEEICLVNQRFIKNDALTIQDYTNSVANKIGNQLTIKRFARLAIGR